MGHHRIMETIVSNMMIIVMTMVHIGTLSRVPTCCKLVHMLCIGIIVSWWYHDIQAGIKWWYPDIYGGIKWWYPDMYGGIKWWYHSFM